jgi:hypothetical protein
MHTAQLKMLVGGQMAKIGDAPLSETERSWLADRLGAFERVGKSIRDVLRADVEASGRPIIMGNGNIWGPYEKPTTTILVEPALPILEEELGELSRDVIQRSISKDAISDAVKELLAQQGKDRGVAPIVRRIFAKFGEAGALVSDTRTVFGAHKPKTAELAVDDPDVEDLE